MEKTIILAVMTILSALMTGILIPYIRQRMSKEKRVEMAAYARIVVKAAEQLITVKEGAEGAGDRKYMYARDLIKKAFPRLAEEEIRTLIESAVYEMERWGEEFVA